ncbi:MAG TPA: putative manganese transporter [Bacteroidales bacterium]|nr:putative manganese transporter [Bacteroidales bacterium]
MKEMLIGVVEETVMITSFVMVMMLIIEYVNVRSKGSWSQYLSRSGNTQLLLAVLLGITPGCLGSYAVVSMYTHRLLGFGSLVATLIATSGDEAFMMFSMIPATAVKITVILFAVALITGFLINMLTRKRKKTYFVPLHFEVHQTEADAIHPNRSRMLSQLKNITFERAILIFGLALFIFGLLSGSLLHEHNEPLPIAGHHEWNWINITFLIVSLIGLFIVVTVSDHFLREHLWGHIIKKHFLKIFLWTLGALLVIGIMMQQVNLEDWLRSNQITILIAALLIGLIPISGPNMIFITLFFNQTIPFSVLLANSIVQDGHGAIPLLAESKKGFIAAKGINLLVGLIAGLAGFFLHF